MPSRLFFSKPNCLSYVKHSWNILETKLFVLLAAWMFKYVFSTLIGVVVFGAFLELRGWNVLIAFFSALVSWSFLQVRYLQLCLRISNNEKQRETEFTTQSSTSFILLSATILATLCIFLGLGLFLVPGLIFMARFSLCGLTIVDNKLSAINSLLNSYVSTKKFANQILVLMSMMLAGIATFGWFFIGFEMVLDLCLCLIYLKTKNGEPVP